MTAEKITGWDEAMKENKTIKREKLQWWDVVVVSIILFGFAIYNSTSIFFTTSTEVLEQGTVFTSLDNWFGIFTIIIELSLSYLYLKIRRFDFSQWKYRITWKGTLAAVGIFVLMSLAMDLLDIVHYGWKEATAYVGQGGIWYVLSEIDFSLILFSLMNGVYEEIFFLGVCTSVPESQQKGVLIYSLVIRTAFHTYQGMVSALGIGLIIGGIYYYLYKKKGQNLYPYMLSHSFADIFGVGFLALL